jgi:DsbC/DsbD-like thiol-disulfide interchange protein
MPLHTRLSVFFLLLMLPLFAGGAGAQEASPWADGHRSRVRLVAGSADGESRLAGIEIVLDHGFKTYWRNPGESGLPPVFDWSKSRNVAGVEVLWPVPSRFEDAAGVTYGYQGSVVFPVRVRPLKEHEPVGLALRLDYGVCKDICIPAQAELSLDLPRDTSGAHQLLVKRALARVPTPKPLSAEGDLSVVSVEPKHQGGEAKLLVVVRTPEGASPSLFVEGPENWFLASGRMAAPGAFVVDVLERPRDAKGPVTLRFTLAAGDKAVETTTRLDAERLAR